MKARRRNRPVAKKARSGSAPVGESTLLLDHFSHSDLKKWKIASRALHAHWYGLFFALESQRVQHYSELLYALRSTGGTSVELEDWVRVVGYKYTLVPLSSAGSTIWTGGRFNIGQGVDPTRFPTFPALYIGENGETALRERYGIKQKGRGGLSPEELALTTTTSHSLVTISGRVDNVFDLTKKRSLNSFVAIISKFKIPKEIVKLGSSIGKPTVLIKTNSLLYQNLMKENWREDPAQFSVPANSQVFGRLVKDAGYDGMIYSSTKASNRCLVIFLENFENSDSHLELSGEYPDSIEHPSLNSDTWKNLV